MKSFSIYRVPAVAGSTIIERKMFIASLLRFVVVFNFLLLFPLSLLSHSLFLCLLSLTVDSILSYYVYLFPPWVATSCVPFRLSISFLFPPLSQEAYYSIVLFNFLNFNINLEAFSNGRLMIWEFSITWVNYSHL